MTIFTLRLHLLQSLMPCKTRKAITDVVLASLDRWQESHSRELPWTWMVLSSLRWCPGVGEWLHLKRKNSGLGVKDELQGEVTESVIIADGFLSCPPWGLMEPFSFLVDKCLWGFPLCSEVGLIRMSTKRFHGLSPTLDGHCYINNRIFYLCGHQISQTTFPYSTISAISYRSSHTYLQIPLSHPILLKPLPFLPRQFHLLSEQQPSNVLHSLYCEQPILHLMTLGSFKTDHSLNC